MKRQLLKLFTESPVTKAIFQCDISTNTTTNQAAANTLAVKHAAFLSEESLNMIAANLINSSKRSESVSNSQ